MKILKFEVGGLFGRNNSISREFKDDLNILTGRNGAGKTTILKVLWYVISGNISLALSEVNFKKLYVQTDLYDISVYKINHNTCKIEFSTDNQQWEFEDRYEPENDIFISAEENVNSLLIEKGSSVFLPTFRRIEGGFTLNPRKNSPGLLATRAKSDVEDSLVALSSRLSNGSHKFVSAMSTVDIVSLVLRQYSEMSDESNILQQLTSQEIIETIKAYKSDADGRSVIDANNVLDGIRLRIEKMERARETIMTPIEEMRKLVAKLFTHAGITINNRLSFGEAANAINSDSLSAGEKQMLSFICYNAFHRDSIIFIDEPELSLHVDWQRQLFPILQRQQSSNQFIIATHSPFIYAKFPDKEISIDANRGDLGGD